MHIPQHIIEQLVNSADLVSIIGRHVDLKGSGNSFKACCPFHEEKTPSFYVRPQEGYYHCFGCKASGNAIKFLMEYEGQTFLEAVETLSKQTGISIPKSAPNPAFNYQKNTPQSTQKTPKKQIKSIPNTQNPQPNTVEKQAEKQVAQPPVILSDINDINAALADAADYEATDYENEPFFDDAQLLYEPVNKPIPTATNTPPQNPNSAQSQAITAATAEITAATDIRTETKADTKTGNLYELLNKLNEYYQAQRKTQPNAFMYFSKRGLTEKTMNTFELGYAPQGWQHLQEAFPTDIEGLKVLGLVRESSKPNANDYCLLRDRVIFPIKDHKGRVVGFAGRSIESSSGSHAREQHKHQPKYINSPESVVFKKQHILYGLYEGRQAKAKDWLMVEGYMDVIALHQAGIYGAVASMGTATNVEQIKRLFKQSPKLTLAFDGDSAGRSAAWRTLEVSLPALLDEYELRFLLLPENEDPDSLVKSEGEAAMRERIADAPPLSEFLYTELANRHDMSTPEGKGQLMGVVKKLLSNLPEYSSYRRLLTNEIKEKLGLAYTPFKSKQQLQAQQAALAKYRDALLNFDSKYSQEDLLVYLLLLKPTLVNESTQCDDIMALLQTTQAEEVHAAQGLLAQLITHITHTLPFSHSPDTLAYSQFVLSVLVHEQHPAQKTALLTGLNQFLGFIQLTQAANADNKQDNEANKQSDDQADNSQATQAWITPIFQEMSLAYQAQLLQKQMSHTQDIHTQKALNEKLTQVRKQLQFREKDSL